MDIKKESMKKLLIYLIPVLAFCLLNITSCKDEAEELPRLLDQVTAVLGDRLPRSEDPRRLLRAEELVRKLRGGAELNANPGQLSGWLCAGMFIKH